MAQKQDIILAGVGGQGILSIAATIGLAAIQQGLNLKQAEVHGMSQRGGAVQSHLRISEAEIASDLIPRGRADLIIGMEPMESLRYLPYLSEDGWLVVNSEPTINIPDYPDISDLEKEIRKIPRHILLNAKGIAKEIKAFRSTNIVLLGAASHHLMLEVRSFEDALHTLFRSKGERVVEDNIRALHAGREEAAKLSEA